MECTQGSNEEAYKLYLEASPTLRARSKKCQTAAVAFIARYGIDEGERKNLTLKFSRLVDSRQRCKNSLAFWNQKVFYDLKQEIKVHPKTAGRPVTKLCDEPCIKTSRKILRDQIDHLEEFAKEQKISKMSALQMLICHRIWHKGTLDQSQPASIPVIDAVALINNINLSMQQYQTLRSTCLPFGINFPTRNRIDLAKGSLHPPIATCQIKSSVDMKDMLTETGQALLSQTKIVGNEAKKFVIIGKFGCDGSGSHKVRHQRIYIEDALEETPNLNPQNVSNFLLSCYCPLEIKEIGESEVQVWKNPQPNSIAFARPVSLTRAEESREILQSELMLPFELIRNPFLKEIKNADGEIKYTMEFKTECSMVDGKMVSLIQGDSGAFCHLCTSTREEANNHLNILAGFEMNKDYNSCQTAWRKLRSGEICYSSVERQGQCHESLLKADLHCISVLHFKLRSLDFVLKILYHLVADHKSWFEGGSLTQSCLKRAKKECIDKVLESTGILLDSQCSGGGNTNSGPIADRYFEPANREVISSLILNRADKTAYTQLLSYFNQMLSVTLSVTDKIVNIKKVRQLGIDLMHHTKSAFLDNRSRPWIMITPSVHQLCAHAWQLFELNNGKSIAVWSENPLESWNEYVRSFKSGSAARARQCSVQTNIHDVLRRMLIKSHPDVAARRYIPRCSICNEMGHTARSSIHKRPNNALTEEQLLIASLYEN